MTTFRLAALLALTLLAACAGDFAQTAALSHAWPDTAADGGLNAAPAPGSANSVGQAP